MRREVMVEYWDSEDMDIGARLQALYDQGWRLLATDYRQYILERKHWWEFWR